MQLYLVLLLFTIRFNGQINKVKGFYMWKAILYFTTMQNIENLLWWDNIYQIGKSEDVVIYCSEISLLLLSKWFYVNL